MKRFWFSSSKECSNNNEMDCPNFVNFEPREKLNVNQAAYILTNQEHGDEHRNNT
jgi:hypothetical protein